MSIVEALLILLTIVIFGSVLTSLILVAGMAWEAFKPNYF